MINITRFWKFTISWGLLVKFWDTEVQHNKIVNFSVLKFSNRIRLSIYKNLQDFIFFFCKNKKWLSLNKIKYLKGIFINKYFQFLLLESSNEHLKINVCNLKTDDLQLWFLNNSDLRISAAEFNSF